MQHWRPSAGSQSFTRQAHTSGLVRPQVRANCRPSMFAYPAPVTEESSATVAKLPTAVLSTTARARERAKRRTQDKSGRRVRAPTSGEGSGEADPAPAAGTSSAAAAGEPAGRPSCTGNVSGVTGLLNSSLHSAFGLKLCACSRHACHTASAPFSRVMICFSIPTFHVFLCPACAVRLAKALQGKQDLGVCLAHSCLGRVWLPVKHRPPPFA